MAIKERKIAHINTKTEYFQDIIDKVPSPIARYGIFTMTILFVIVGTFLSLLRYPEAISGEAVVVPSSPPIEVFTRTSGRISLLLKSDQERLKKGDWVIILDNTADFKDILSLDSALINIDSQNLKEMNFDISRLRFLKLGDLQKVYSDFINAVDQLRLFRNQMAIHKLSSIDTKRTENLTLVQKQQAVELEGLKRQLILFKTDYERAKILYDQKVLSKSEIEQKESQLISAQMKVNDMLANMHNTNVQKNLVEREGNIQIITNNESNLINISNLTNAYTQLIYELAEWKNKYVISAPIDGKLNLYEYRVINQFVPIDKKAFTISPLTNSQPFAFIKLPTRNSGKVKVGLRCIIKLNNFPYQEYGFLEGTVSSISATPNDGFYTVKAKLPNSLITNIKKQIKTNGELIGTGEVVIKNTSLLQRLFSSLIQSVN